MKLLATLLLLVIPACAQSAAKPAPIVGEWSGTVVSHGQQVPVHLRISSTADSLQSVLINGPETAAATTTTFSGNHLLLTFSYYARTLDTTLGTDGKFTGTFGTSTVRYPITLAPGAPTQPPAPGPQQSASLNGDWEIAVPQRQRGVRVAASYRPGPQANPSLQHSCRHPACRRRHWLLIR